MDMAATAIAESTDWHHGPLPETWGDSDSQAKPRKIDRMEPAATKSGGWRRGMLALTGHGQSPPGLPVIHGERKWRMPDILMSNQPKRGIVASRWDCSDQHEHVSEIVGDYHTIGISLRPMKLSFWLDGTSTRNQHVVPGAVQVTGPTQRARSVFHDPCDVLHLHVQNALLRECAEWSCGGRPQSGLLVRDPWFAHDPLIERLGRALLSVGETGEAFSTLYADTLSLTIVARLLSLYGECLDPESRRRIAPLPKWRLKRTIEFIEANVDGTIRLADLAQAAGLTRMHFAAQFRKATGLRPHDYVLWYRVERAKNQLRTSDLPIVQVALATGFHSQAHFTAVFKRFTGLPPYRWRYSGSAPGVPGSLPTTTAENPNTAAAHGKAPVERSLSRL